MTGRSGTRLSSTLRTGWRGRLGVAVLALALLSGCNHGRTAAAQGPAPAASDPTAAPTSDAPSPSASASPSKAASPTPGKGANNPALVPGSIAGKVIVIDPGHNGGNGAHPEIINKQVDSGNGMKSCDTTGTQTNDGYQEAAFTWDVGARMVVLLRQAGATVILTRNDNTSAGPCITERAAIGNRNHAAVAVSIHGDGGTPGGTGFHIMEPAPVSGAPSAAIIGPSHRLAVAIRDQYRQVLSPANYIGSDGINPRSDMGGLNLSTVPKVMIECGNMRNAGDAAKMKDSQFRQKAAVSFANGVINFLKTG